MSRPPLRIATRGSELALRRARAVQAMLAAQGVESELSVVRTTGDRKAGSPLDPAAVRTAFTKELASALRRKRADLAVHALPDVPTDPVPGLTIAAVLRRDDPRDALVLNRLVEATTLEELPRGARIGTASVWHAAQLRASCPDIEVVQLRGDLPTRLHKVDDGQVHGTIASVSALHALGVSQSIAALLEPPAWLPVPAQGAVAIQTREDDGATRAIVASMDDRRTRLDTTAERTLLSALEGGRQSPMGALVIGGESGTLHGAIADPQSGTLLRAALPMDDEQPELVGVRVANELRGQGASRILDGLRGATRIPAPQPDI